MTSLGETQKSVKGSTANRKWNRLKTSYQVDQGGRFTGNATKERAASARAISIELLRSYLFLSLCASSCSPLFLSLLNSQLTTASFVPTRLLNAYYFDSVSSNPSLLPQPTDKISEKKYFLALG